MTKKFIAITGDNNVEIQCSESDEASIDAPLVIGIYEAEDAAAAKEMANNEMRHDWGLEEGYLEAVEIKELAPEKKELTVKIKDLTSGKVETWTVPRILEEINRDHSDDWTDYNEFDWVEGWMAWIEGDEYYTMII